MGDYPTTLEQAQARLRNITFAVRVVLEAAGLGRGGKPYSGQRALLCALYELHVQVSLPFADEQHAVRLPSAEVGEALRGVERLAEEAVAAAYKRGVAEERARWEAKGAVEPSRGAETIARWMLGGK